MPLDGIFLTKLNTELSDALTLARADKIHQPSNDELVFFMRTNKGNRRLIINLSASPRIYLSSTSPENPDTPPRFCTLLRKYLQGAKLKAVNSVGVERLTDFIFESRNEMGDLVTYTLAVELISGSANAILISEGRIIDSLRHSDIELQDRMIQPGAVYRLPDGQNKLNPFTESSERIADEIMKTDNELWQGILKTVGGICPMVARHIAGKIASDVTLRIGEIENARQKLVSAIDSFKKEISSPTIPTEIVYENKNNDFYFIPIEGDNHLLASSLSELLRSFYQEKQAREQAAAKTGELMRFLTTLHSRILRKADARKKDLEKCKDAEDLRICGELIKANLYNIEKGMAYADLSNYYDENMAVKRVKLDTALSPADNATRYFKEYKKRMAARGMLDGLIEESEREADYIESVIEELSRSTASAEIEAIRDELEGSGYLRTRNVKKKKPSAPGFLKIKTPSGNTLLVGRNNTENDNLTLRIAERNDLWFHTKGIHGSHAILVLENREPTKEDILFSAAVAAYHSKARASSQVPVDYTFARYVKKPSGAKPGMVIYTNQSTVYVTPKEI